jgi:hypothetical protein
MSISEGQVEVHGEGQFWIQDGDETPPVDSWDQSNGLIVTATVGAVVLTGEALGPIAVTLEVRPDDPGLTDLGSEWDDIVEASVRCQEGPLRLLGLEQGFVPGLSALDSQGPGDYRVRVHVTGRDTPTRDADGFPRAADRFLIRCWPAPPQPPLLIRLTDQRGLGTRLSWLNRPEPPQGSAPVERRPEPTTRPDSWPASGAP